MKKIVFISTIVLGLAALNTSTNVNASMLTENHEKVSEVSTKLINDTQADTIAELGNVTNPLKSTKDNHKNTGTIIKLKELPKKAVHHKVRHHKKVNKKKIVHLKVLSTSVNQAQTTNTQTTPSQSSVSQSNSQQSSQVQSSSQQSSLQQSVQSSQSVSQPKQQIKSGQASSSAAEQIAQAESGGSYTAQNGKYFGKFQLDKSYLHGDYSPANQERVFKQYCQQRYGSVEGALVFRQQHGWY